MAEVVSLLIRCWPSFLPVYMPSQAVLSPSSEGKKMTTRVEISGPSQYWSRFESKKRQMTREIKNLVTRVF